MHKNFSFQGLTIKQWLRLLFVDHGFVRLLYNNFYKVSNGVYRSSHPLPFHFRRLNRLGIKTIINLRGGNPRNGFYIIEKLQCEKNQIKLIDFSLSSSKLMSAKKVIEAKNIFKTVEYPIVLHCKSGADRAGLMSTLYNIMILKKNFPEANELKWYYGHLAFWSTGVLDLFFTHWQEFHENNPTISFEGWIETHYNPQEIEKSFYLSTLGEWFARKILRRE